jgi:hypothetical protein
LEATQNAGKKWLLKEPKSNFWLFIKLFPGAFPKSQEAHIIFIKPVHLPACISLVPTGQISVKFDVDVDLLREFNFG